MPSFPQTVAAIGERAGDLLEGQVFLAPFGRRLRVPLPSTSPVGLLPAEVRTYLIGIWTHP